MTPSADEIRPVPGSYRRSDNWPQFHGAEDHGMDGPAPAVQPVSHGTQNGSEPPPIASAIDSIGHKQPYQQNQQPSQQNQQPYQQNQQPYQQNQQPYQQNPQPYQTNPLQQQTVPHEAHDSAGERKVARKSTLPVALNMGAISTARAFVAPFRGSRGASSFRRDIYYASLRNFLSNFEASRSLGYIAPTAEVLQKTSRANMHVLESVPLGDGATGHWLYRSSSKYVLLYFHGGGYIQYMSPGHAKYLFALQRKINRLGYEVSILAVEYTVAPFKRYPGQLAQAVTALKYLVDRQGRRPRNIIIGGDSAGGNLATALLLHLANPNPNVSTVNLTTPLRGALLISPIVSWDTASPSFKKNRYSDILTSKALQKASDAFLGPGRQHDAYSEPLRAPVEWWQRVAGIVDEIMIWGGGAEVMIDGIREFAVRVEVGFERAYQQVEVGSQNPPEPLEHKAGFDNDPREVDDFEKDEVFLTAPLDARPPGFKFEFEPASTEDLREEMLVRVESAKEHHIVDYDKEDRRDHLEDDLKPGAAYDDSHPRVMPPPDHRLSLAAEVEHPLILAPTNTIPPPVKILNSHVIDYNTDDHREHLDDDLADKGAYNQRHQPVLPPPDPRRAVGPEAMLPGTHNISHLAATQQHITLPVAEDIRMIDAIIEEAHGEASAERALDAASISSDYGDRHTKLIAGGGHADVPAHLRPTSRQIEPQSPNERPGNPHASGLHDRPHHDRNLSTNAAENTSKEVKRRSMAVREEDDYIHTIEYDPHRASITHNVAVYGAMDPTTITTDAAHNPVRSPQNQGEEWPQQDPRRRIKYVETPRMCHEEMIVDYILRIGGKREGARSIERWFETLLAPDLRRGSMKHMFPGEEERKRYLKGEISSAGQNKVAPPVPPPPPPAPPVNANGNGHQPSLPTASLTPAHGGGLGDEHLVRDPVAGPVGEHTLLGDSVTHGQQQQGFVPGSLDRGVHNGHRPRGSLNTIPEVATPRPADQRAF